MDVPIIGTPPSGPMLDGTFQIFTPIYNVPAVSVVDILNNISWFNYLDNAPSSVQDTLQTQTQDLTDAAMLATNKLQAATVIAQSAIFSDNKALQTNITNLNDSGIMVTAVDGGNETTYKLSISGGIPSLIQYIPGLSVLNSNDTALAARSVINSLDTSETVDFNQRYIAMDASFYDASDAPNNISFMRVIKADPSIGSPANQVFPPNQGWIQPGITETKFKQFILSSVSSASQERMQIVETSQAFQVLFYGKKPEILNLSGIIKNTRSNPWNANMTFLWDSLMRGTKLVEQGNILQLYIDGTIYNGYPFGFQRSQMSPTDYLVSFSMSFIIKEKIMTSRNTGNYNIVQTSSVTYSAPNDKIATITSPSDPVSMSASYANSIGMG